MPETPAIDGAGRPGFTVRRFETIDSTNRYVLDEARAGAAEGLVVVADEQTAGRGRRGRTWTAPPGASLLVSVLLRPALPVGRIHVVTMAAGLALADAVEAAGVGAELKWPNDLLVGGRTLAGLLAESEIAADGEVRAVVIGAGLNVNWPEFPPELEGAATALNLEAGHDIERSAVLDAFLDGLGARYRALDAVATEYRRRLGTLGRRVRVEQAEGVTEGRAVDVGPSGELLVETGPGCIAEIHVGDVIHLR